MSHVTDSCLALRTEVWVLKTPEVWILKTP